MTLTELARLLGVSRNQVWTWHHRRDRNGFPEAVAHGKRGAPLFDRDEVVEWYASYGSHRRSPRRTDNRTLREKMEAVRMR